MQIEETTIISPSLELEKLTDADACASELKRCLNQSLACAARVVGYKELAVRHAVNVGYVLLRAKELVPHGEFMEWCDTHAEDIGRETCRKWMGLANSHKNGNLDFGEDTTLSLAYRKGFESSQGKEQGEGEEGQEVKFFTPMKPPQFKLPLNEWTEFAARDFIYQKGMVVEALEKKEREVRALFPTL